MAPATSARESFAGRFPPPPEINLKNIFFFKKKKNKGMYFLRLSFFLVILTALTDL